MAVVMPMDPSRYPADWKAISRRIREREGNRCKWCGVSNGELGARDRSGEWHQQESIDGMNSTEGYQLFGGYPNIIKIVLTVAHLDHDTANNADDNLAAICQKCHLNYDREQHIANRKRNKLARSGQTVMEVPS